MFYADRMANYARQHPTTSSAPELTDLTPTQRRRARHKMNHHKAAVLRRKQKGE